MATATSRAVVHPKYVATVPASVVAGPRPSSARTPAPSAAIPISGPPPQSPVMAPRAGHHALRPEGELPTQLTPAPTVTATPWPVPVAAHSTAKTSLAT